ncbi:hypothetical protein U0070_001873 [Myodes glareolus]|uniref:Centromere protein X n=1 Tax=Myodes glareolus TaxID=447135 RepID=A0AAW0HJV6_MYOGA
MTELVSKVLHLHFRDCKTKVSGDALQLMAEFLKIFVVEAAVRGVQQAQAEDLDIVDVDQLEKVGLWPAESRTKSHQRRYLIPQFSSFQSTGGHQGLLSSLAIASGDPCETGAGKVGRLPTPPTPTIPIHYKQKSGWQCRLLAPLHQSCCVAFNLTPPPPGCLPEL